MVNVNEIFYDEHFKMSGVLWFCHFPSLKRKKKDFNEFALLNAGQFLRIDSRDDPTAEFRDKKYK